MSHWLAGEPPSASRRTTPLIIVGYSAAEWELLTRLPGRAIVAATAPTAGRPRRPIAAGLAGLEAVAAGRAFDSDLVRAVVAAIYARPDEVSPPDEGLADPVDLLAHCRAATRVLARRADPADSAAYRQWVQSVAARVCGVPASDGTARDRTDPVGLADRRFLDRLGQALGLR